MLQIYDCARLAAADGAPGEVAEATTEGLVVAAAGGGVHVKRVRSEATGRCRLETLSRPAG